MRRYLLELFTQTKRNILFLEDFHCSGALMPVACLFKNKIAELSCENIVKILQQSKENDSTV